MQWLAAILATIVLSTACTASSDGTSPNGSRATGSSQVPTPVVTSSKAAPSSAATSNGSAKTSQITTGGSQTASSSASVTSGLPPAPVSPSATASTATTVTSPAVPAGQTIYGITLRRDLLVLMHAYPGIFSGIEARSGQVWLLAKSGARILYDDRMPKSFDEKLAGADLQDSLEQAYPLQRIAALMPLNLDPGRIRCYPLLDTLYGASESERYAALVRVPYGTQNLLFTAKAGAADRFRLAAGQVAALVKGQPEISAYAYPSSGTWNSRNIAGTTRASAHGFGIAIDLHAHSDDYWTTASPAAGTARLASYPAALVRAFEDNGFIWGGKWNHFDIMHYEFRPELLLKARWFGGAVDAAKPWHQGADVRIAEVSRLVALVDDSLRDSGIR